MDFFNIFVSLLIYMYSVLKKLFIVFFIFCTQKSMKNQGWVVFHFILQAQKYISFHNAILICYYLLLLT